jgi:hypothetical protein
MKRGALSVCIRVHLWLTVFLFSFIGVDLWLQLSS